MTIEPIHILSFYKFVPIENPNEERVAQKIRAKKTGILGRIIVGTEGINGSVSGTQTQVEAFKRSLTHDERFKDMRFKEEKGLTHPFTKFSVKVKDEIVTLGIDVDLKKSGKHMRPKEFLTLKESGEEFILLDTRNDYEWKVGRFKDAITLPIKNFREFPAHVKMLEDKKDKKIVMYCTGGIRCEKASAYMRQEGFEDVYQLEDGIINYCQELPNTEWEGKCFVFDKRLMSEGGSEKQTTTCDVCGGTCDLYKNCRNASCDVLTVMCVTCEQNLNGCCSKECMNEFMAWCNEKARQKQLVKIQKRMSQ